MTKLIELLLSYKSHLGCPLKDLPATFPKVLNLLDYSTNPGSKPRVYVNKDFVGCTSLEGYFNALKAVVWPESDSISWPESTGHGIAVFDLVDQRMGKLSSFPGSFNMLAPPSWFTANHHLCSNFGEQMKHPQPGL
ncbi:hypothetical protein V6N13_044239 [Hibiscus sabdariffa]|uniref:Uncharacterized protein n=1 Tax=Hibiscus sabdariffa TaxID=183260 RepID=A0ABR1ZIR0_9ROSI